METVTYLDSCSTAFDLTVGHVQTYELSQISTISSSGSIDATGTDNLFGNSMKNTYQVD